MNMFRLMKLGALFMAGIIPAIAIVLFIIFNFGLLMSAIVTISIVILQIIVLDKTIFGSPLIKMQEAKGLLVMGLDSTGVCPVGIAEVKGGFLSAEIEGKKVGAAFSRDLIHYIKTPVKAIISLVKPIKPNGTQESEKILIEMLTPEEKGKAYFSIFDKPFLIYNKITGRFMTKAVWEETEQALYWNNTLSYALKKQEDLSSHLRDFTRHVIDETRNKGIWRILGNKWFWIIMVVAILLLVLLFAPVLLPTIEKTVSVFQGNPGVVTPAG